MGIKQLKLDVNELAIGMFVSGLDRPWTQTPFPLQGFYIRDAEELRQLKLHCKHVYIDVVKGRKPDPVVLQRITARANDKSQRRTARAAQKIKVAPLSFRRDVYPVKTPLKKEIKKVQQLHQRVYLAIEEVMTHVSGGGQVPAAETKRLASQMVDSVLRNPDAFAWLSRVRDVDEYTYSHAVRSAVWAILFGRHAGLAKKDLDVLAMGVLLKDVGKAKLDQTLLSKANRSPEEEAEYRNFVQLGVDILRQTPGIDPRVISVVRTHQERLDGSGYPQGLRGDKIPLLGKIAGIVTFYDETTNPRGVVDPIAPSKAIARLYELRDNQFQEELVVEFIRAVGLYPTGTLVELNTGEVGVVVEQNFERRLKPKVLLLLDAVKNPLPKPILLDLAEDERRKQALKDKGEALTKIEIARDLEPGSYKIDINRVRDSYLLKPVSHPTAAGQKRGLLRLLGLGG